jgi:general secretion pathway protein M
MRPLSARERRFVAIGLAIALAGVVWLLVLGPLIGGFFDRAAERRQLADAYDRNERLVASLPALRAQAEAQRRDAARFAIAAPSEALAAQQLKTRLQKLATDEGFAVAGVQDLQDDASANTVKLRADLTLSLAQLYRTLRRLENEDAYVIVEYLSISADKSLAAGHLAPLDVRLELASPWRPKGQP